MGKPPFGGEVVRLGDVCEVVGGATPKTSNPAYWDGDIKWATPAEIRDNTYVLEDTAKRLTEAGFKSANLHMMPAGTVLLTTRAPIGKVALAGSDMCCNQGFKCLVCSDAVSNKWLYRYLKYHTPRLQAMGTGATFKELSKRAVSNLEIVLPSMDNQLAAVHKLAGVERVMAIVDQQLAKLDSLVKSRFVEMFGDQKTNSLGLPTSKLGDVAFVGSSKRVFKDELKDSGIPFFRGTEVGTLAFGERVKPELFIEREHYEELVAHTGKPEVGDLLMPSICPAGQIWLVDTTQPFYFKDGRVIWVRPNHKILDSTFLQHALRNRFVSDFDSFASGTTFAELKIFVLKNLDIPLPPISLQREFANFASRVDKLRFVATGIVLINPMT